MKANAKIKLKDLVWVMVVATVFVLLLVFSPDAAKGIKDGIEISVKVVVPSLYPFVVMSVFIIKSGVCEKTGKILEPIMKNFFHLPGSAACAVIMSLIGGFPVGAKMTAELIKNNLITKKQGRRMMFYVVNAGPAFVIGAVGNGFLSSTKAGIILLISLVLSSLIIGFVSGLFEKDDIHNSSKEFNAEPLSDSLITAVDDGTKTMISICAWIIIFSGFSSLIINFNLSPTVNTFINMLCEVTRGCYSYKSSMPLSLIAFVLGWCGLSVHCQVLPFVKVTDMKISAFFAARLINAGLASVIAEILFTLFPCEISVFESFSKVTPQIWSVSAPAGIGVLIMGIVLMLDLAPREKT